MSIRSINKKQNANTTPWTMSVQEFPKDKDGVIYVRQSSLTQQQKNIHSFEMQTDKFLEYFRNMGCTGHIETIADDEGLSGTLDIHKRKGLARVVRLIEEGKIGWVGGVFVNRFTRDPWLITPAVLMKKCYEHDVWIATLRMNFNFKDEYCQRVFMLEAEESARHLKWMKVILGGAKSVASDNGYYDGRFIVPGYIVDRTDEQRKRYVIYEPHARVVRWLFRRFLELDGNLPLLCREIEAMPYVFPRFEEWVDPKTISRFSLYRKKMDNRTPEGDYKLFRHGLVSILTNPIYIGWWIPLDGGVIENNHEPIVEEVLFTYAHRLLSTHDLNGERQKPGKVVRHATVEAILKKVIKDPDGIPIYANSATRCYLCNEQKGRLVMVRKFAVAVKAIDSVFLEKFFERVQTIDSEQFEDFEDKIEQKRLAQEQTEAHIKASIKEATLKMKRINDLLTNSNLAEPLPQSMIDDLVKQYKGLEGKKRELEQELAASKEETDEDEAILYEIHTLIPRIVALWDNLPFAKKLQFVGALTRHVFLSRVAPGWLKMEIHWKIPEWEVDIAHIRRGFGGERWKEDDDERLVKLFPTEDAGDILEAFPTRNWRSIKARASEKGIYRLRNGRNTIPVNTPVYFDMSFEDLQYVVETGLVLTTKNAQWSN